MVSFVSRPFSLTINGADYSDALIELRLNDSAWDESGEIASILEAKISRPQGGVDPLLNEDLLHGSKVVLRLANDAGIIPIERARTLYVIRTSFDESSQICDFTACDILTFLNWDNELDDTEVEKILLATNAFNFGIHHADLAQRFLQKKGLAPGLPPTWPDNYRINYPVSPSTWVSGARELVASALGYLWCSPSGAIAIEPIVLSRAPAFHLSLDQCESFRVSQVNTPSEKIVAVCNQPIVSRSQSYQWNPATGNLFSAPLIWQEEITISESSETYVEDPVSFRYLRIVGAMGQYIAYSEGSYSSVVFEWEEQAIEVEYFFFSFDPFESIIIQQLTKIQSPVLYYKLDFIVGGSPKSVHVGSKGLSGTPLSVQPGEPDYGEINLTIAENEIRSGLLSELGFSFGNIWSGNRIAKLIVNGQELQVE